MAAMLHAFERKVDKGVQRFNRRFRSNSLREDGLEAPHRPTSMSPPPTSTAVHHHTSRQRPLSVNCNQPHNNVGDAPLSPASVSSHDAIPWVSTTERNEEPPLSPIQRPRSSSLPYSAWSQHLYNRRGSAQSQRYHHRRQSVDHVQQAIVIPWEHLPIDLSRSLHECNGSDQAMDESLPNGSFSHSHAHSHDQLKLQKTDSNFSGGHHHHFDSVLEDDDENNEDNDTGGDVHVVGSHECLHLADKHGEEHDLVVMPIEDPLLAYAQLLQAHTCYDAMPNNNKLVVLDLTMDLRKAFYGLLYNSTRSALLYDVERQSWAGVITITDFIHALLKYDQYHRTHDRPRGGLDVQGNPIAQKSSSTTNVPAPAPSQPPLAEKAASIESRQPTSRLIEAYFAKHTVGAWKKLLDSDVGRRSFLSINVNMSLLAGCRRLLRSKLRRMPVIDCETGNPLFVLSHERVLKFMWIFGKTMPRSDLLDHTPKELGIGTWQSLLFVHPDTLLWHALELLIERDVSAVPVIERGTNRVLDVYSRFDVVSLCAENLLDNLHAASVSDALGFKKQIYVKNPMPLVYCTESDVVEKVLVTLVDYDVHRVVIVDNEEQMRLVGVVSVSDLISYLVLKPYNEAVATCHKASSFASHSSPTHSESSSSMDWNLGAAAADITNGNGTNGTVPQMIPGVINYPNVMAPSPRTSVPSSTSSSCQFTMDAIPEERFIE